MTTEMRCEVFDDVSQRNSIRCFRIAPSLRLSAVVWTMESTGKIKDDRWYCLDYGIKKITANLPDHEIWLIAGDGTALPDDRVTRYYGFWKRYKRFGYDFREGRIACESMIACEGGLRFFGGLKYTPDEIDMIRKVFETSEASLIALHRTQASATVNALVRKGWNISYLDPPGEVFDYVCARSGVVMQLYGHFDDPLVSVAAIGLGDVVLGLAKAS
ncbi:MAG: hypothetical protein ACK5TY_01825 [Verrucomicrobiota bacterium]